MGRGEYLTALRLHEFDSHVTFVRCAGGGSNGGNDDQGRTLAAHYVRVQRQVESYRPVPRHAHSLPNFARWFLKDG